MITAEIKASLDINFPLNSFDNIKVVMPLKLSKGKAETECNGNVTKENVEILVDFGIDYISNGLIIHSPSHFIFHLKSL